MNNHNNKQQKEQQLLLRKWHVHKKIENCAQGNLLRNACAAAADADAGKSATVTGPSHCLATAAETTLDFRFRSKPTQLVHI